MRLGFAVKVLGDGGLPQPRHAPLAVGPAPARTRSSALRGDPRLPRPQRHPDVPDDQPRWRPYATHPELPQFHRPGRRVRRASWPHVGARAARALGVRLSTHPGQYAVLNSERPRGGQRRGRRATLELQAALLDAMGAGPGGGRSSSTSAAATGEPRGGQAGFVRGLRAAVGPRPRPAGDRERRPRVRTRATSCELRRAHGLRGGLGRRIHHHCHDPDGVPRPRGAADARSATWPAGQTPRRSTTPRRRRRSMSAAPGDGRGARACPQTSVRTRDLIDPIAFEQLPA